MGSKDSYPQHRWSKEEIAYIKEITPGRSYKEILELICIIFVRQIMNIRAFPCVISYIDLR